MAPNLIARFDYGRFAPVELPAALVGLDLTNQGLVPDAALLSFLGAPLDTPGPEPVDITADPENTAVHVGGTAEFSVQAGGTAISYQWQIGGTPVSDGVLPSGAVVAGSSTPTVTIESVGFDEDGAEFTCLVSDPCTGLNRAVPCSPSFALPITMVRGLSIPTISTRSSLRSRQGRMMRISTALALSTRTTLTRLSVRLSLDAEDDPAGFE
jgi:hypothetical protein